ncbi:sulfotransferase family protein [Benzoatithermus flavus]|uniref:Sulfotransferase n=1 Tax=Benzoatithermus flavus TaxID=3108223 RepID=A0ABU8XQ87_9PROT
MRPKLHFISGLPRSGSTLLAGILRQNPRFHAAMTGPMGSLFGALLAAMGPQNETALFLSEAQKRDLLRALFETYYRPQADKAVVFDTNRAWCARLSQLLSLFPEAKVLCCVRNVAWIMDSIERLVRRNAFEPSKLFATPEERATVFSRVEALAHRDRLVGFAWSALKEAYYGEHSGSLLLIEYDILCQRPRETLELVYQFLGEPWHEHDFDNVEYAEPEFDAQLATPGLHTVRRKVEFRPRRTVLPPDLFEKYAGLAFWRDPKGSAAWRITVQAGAEPAGG